MASYRINGKLKPKWLICLLLLVWGIIALLIWFDIPALNYRPLSRTQIRLALKMEQGITLLRRKMEQSGIIISPYSDPNQTGFIGEELTPLTTTLGSLVSKRTSTQPRFAPLLYDLILEAGIVKGDTVAINASGSFPALIFASVLALEEIGAKPVLISSIGSSTWGANRPDWTWPDMERLFFNQGLIWSRSRVITPGGSDDRGPYLFESGIPLVKEIAARNGIPLVEPAGLADSVKQRMNVFLKEKPLLFINIGGSHPSLGECAYSHQFPPGLIRNKIPCVQSEPGLIVRFLEIGTPVINLLDIPTLASRYGLPIDPVPFQVILPVN